jgi:hypothetical protein
MRQLAVFVLIMLLVVLPSCKHLREKGLLGRKADTMAVWQAKLRNMRVADSIKILQARLLALENVRLDSVKNSDQERGAWESKYRYNIIVGSFITPENARNFSAELSKKGYKTRIIKLEGTNFEMVSAEAHDSFSNAVTRLNQFQDTVAIDAWLYIIKKK